MDLIYNLNICLQILVYMFSLTHIHTPSTVEQIKDRLDDLIVKNCYQQGRSGAEVRNICELGDWNKNIV